MEANKKLLLEKIAARTGSRTSIEIPEVLSARANSGISVKIPEVLSAKNSGKPRSVVIAEFKGLKKNLSVASSKIRNEIKNAPVEQKSKIKLEYALKHLAEQKSKGNVADSERGPIKSAKFEPHELPEINSILYGFEYNENAPRQKL